MFIFLTLKAAVCGDTAYAPYGVLHIGFSWSNGLRPSLGFVNQKIRRLKLLSAVFYWFLILCVYFVVVGWVVLTYYVIDANKINEANIAGFYTYDKWVPNFVAAINTPGTYAVELPGNSPVYKWTNTIGTVAYQTKVYGKYGPFPGGAVLVQPNGTIIPYGVNTYIPAGIYLSNFYAPKHLYNISS